MPTKESKVTEINKVKEDKKQVIQLTQEEQALTTEQLTRVHQYNALIAEIAGALRAAAQYLCKLHGVDEKEYYLSNDGTQLIKRDGRAK